MQYKFIQDLKNTFEKCHDCICHWGNFSIDVDIGDSKCEEYVMRIAEDISKHDSFYLEYKTLDQDYLQSLIYEEIVEVFKRDNLDTFRQLLKDDEGPPKLGYYYNFESLLEYFNHDRKSILDLLDYVNSKGTNHFSYFTLKQIDEITTVPILDDDEIVKKLISLDVTIDLDILKSYTYEDLLGITNYNLNEEGKKFILRNFSYSKTILTHFFLQGENKFKSLQHSSVHMQWSGSGPALLREEAIVFKAFNYDLDLIKNTAKRNGYFMGYLPSNIRHEISNNKELFMNAGTQSAEFASASLRDNEEVAMYFLKTDPSSFKHLSKRLRDDYKFLMKCYNSLPNASWLYETINAYHYWPALNTLSTYLGESVLNKKLFVNKLLKYLPIQYSFISKRLKRDKNLLAKTLKCWPKNMQYAGRNIRNNRDFVLPWLTMHPYIFRYISKNLRDDYALCEIAVKRYGSYINYASARLKNDKSLALKAVSRSYKSYQYLSLTMKKDLDVMKAAIKRNSKVFKFFPKSLRKNKYFWKDMLKKGDIAIKDIFLACHFTLRRDPDIYEVVLDRHPELASYFSPNILLRFNYKNINQASRQIIFDIYLDTTKTTDIFLLALAKKQILAAGT